MKLGLGTVQFGLNYGVANQQGIIPDKEAASILRYAIQNDINMLDTAVAYGDSENRLGQLGISGWKVVTKIPYVSADAGDIENWVESIVKESLSRLRVDSVYGLLLHKPNQLLEHNGKIIYRVLQKLKEKELVEKIGISIYETSELDDLCSIYKFDLIQAPLNILDQRLISSGWLYRLADRNIELHTRSVFLQGLLLMKSEDRPEKFKRWEALWLKYDKWLIENDMTPLQACLRFALSFPEIAKVIVGVDSLDHLVRIFEAIDGPIPSLPKSVRSNDKFLLNPAMWTGIN